MIFLSFEDVSEIALNEEDLNVWLGEVVKQRNLELDELSVIICSDEYLLKINQEFLNHDYYTDIITFDYSEDGLVSGDLFISLDRVKDNASNFNAHFLDELHRVIVHGVLHLCGQGDKSEEDKSEMTRLENWALDLR